VPVTVVKWAASSNQGGFSTQQQAECACKMLRNGDMQFYNFGEDKAVMGYASCAAGCLVVRLFVRPCKFLKISLFSALSANKLTSLLGTLTCRL
jgi:hypothetical protein